MPVDPVFLVTRWPQPLGLLPAPDWLAALGRPEAASPLPPITDDVRRAVRDVLREGGFSPSGRNKPCSEYIRGVADKGEFPSVDAAVDTGNLAALHGGLPTGVLDLDRLVPPFTLRPADPGASYVFNRSGQELALGGLLCLHDARGPCGSPVKDPMHGKTLPTTTRTLTMVYGAAALPGRAAAVGAWIADTHRRLGGLVTEVALADLG